MSSFSRPSLSLVPDSLALAAEPMQAMPWEGGSAPEDGGWRLDALCAETDPESFFPEKGGSTREAKRVCVGCPVRMQCLEYALGPYESAAYGSAVYGSAV